ncbi:MAG: ABC transporter permease [Caldilineaceae bacterium]|nr:ABC transporter permease [Caldilineaceae bacterium]
MFQATIGRRPLLSAILLLCVLSVISLFLGVRTITLTGLLTGEGDQMMVFLVSRMPRLIAVLAAGTGMSVAGLIMQQLARNKFVTPSTAGTLQSAGLGILVALLVFASATVLQKMLVAFAFALAGAFIFMLILDSIKYKDVILVPLVGIMFGGVISSITIFIAYRYDMIQSLNAWMVGDFSGVLRGRYEMLYVAVPAIAAAYFYADRFTLAGMGETFAVNLGLKYKQIVNIGLGLVALITAAVVLTVGSIPFLGLIVPNVVSLFLGDNMRRALPYTALLGGIFVLGGDIVGRLIIYPYEIPISMIVGVVGSGLFIFLLLRGERYVTS